MKVYLLEESADNLETCCVIGVYANRKLADANKAREEEIARKYPHMKGYSWCVTEETVEGIE